MSDRIPWNRPYAEPPQSEQLPTNEIPRATPAPKNPPCPLCGSEMFAKITVFKSSVWYCLGAIGWDAWDQPIFAPGRATDDEHARRSERSTGATARPE